MKQASAFERNQDYLLGLLREFIRVVGVTWDLPEDLRQKTAEFLASAGTGSVCSEVDRRHCLTAIVKSKFRLNRERVQAFLNSAARRSLYFDPQTKQRLTYYFNWSERSGFTGWATAQRLPEGLMSLFDPVTDEESLDHLHQQLTTATINRSDARRGVQKERRLSILRSIFGSWIFEVVERRQALAYSTGQDLDEVEEDYFEHIQQYYPQALKRSCGAFAVSLSARQIEEQDARTLRAWLSNEIDSAYKQLSNYSYLLLLFRFPEDKNTHGKAWEIIHDATLYAERSNASDLKAGFFHPEEIGNATASHVTSIDLSLARFSSYQYGFSFRDCIVLSSEKLTNENPKSDIDSVILLLEKNVADETPIPCPACRSLDIRGNSYPIFGVKSWECQNSICPDRSAFDRGNRFSVVSILRAEASKNPDALIPAESLIQWKLDVVGAKSDAEILDMLVRHYSLPGDQLTLVNWPDAPRKHLGRRIVSQDFNGFPSYNQDPLENFEKGHFFNRYLNVTSVIPNTGWHRVESPLAWLDLYEGSCLEVLHSVESDAIDGGITSPPYYNAREYSSWSNLYCYLYDMKIAAEGVFRVLKPGGYYLFNIFDYFDNDNIVAASALGKRRLTLGAYMSQIFRRCGFSIEGNIVWHKGEIEGKRNYNQGNRAPFYQLPLNTWEHILILRKPGNSVRKLSFPGVIFCRPVMKWFNGENRHGHSAPFPDEIPSILCSQLGKGANILDPFAGSLTTASVCHVYRQNCMAVELHKSYCDLGLERIKQIDAQLGLFDCSATEEESV